MKVEIAHRLYEVEFRNGVYEDGMPIDGIADHVNCVLTVPDYISAPKLAKVADSAEREILALSNISNAKPATFPRMVGKVG